jgi:hypothetical protein
VDKPKKRDDLGKALGLPETAPASRAVIELEAVGHNDSASVDFEKSRAATIEVMDSAGDAIEQLANIADQSQHPRAFEVLGQLLKTKLEASRELMTLQKDIRAVRDADTPNSEKGRTVNQLFVSTNELQNMLKNMERK